MASETEDVFETVTVFCPAGARLDFSFGYGSEMNIVPVSAASYDKEEPDQQVSSKSCVQAICWGGLSAAQRKIGHDVAPKFKRLQQRMRGEAAQERWRDELHGYCDDVSNILMSEAAFKSELDDELYGQVVEDAVWRLLEIFFVGNATSSDIVTEDLVWWLQQHASMLLRGCHGAHELLHLNAYFAKLQQQAEPERDGMYWSTMRSLMAMGAMRDATTLLGAHSLWSRWSQPLDADERARLAPQMALLEAVNVLMRRMPRYSTSAANGAAARGEVCDSLPQFTHAREQWCALANRLLLSGIPQLKASAQAAGFARALQDVEWMTNLIKLMVGDAEQLKRCCGGNWLLLLVAGLQHSQPTLPRRDLPRAIERMREVAPQWRDNGSDVEDECVQAQHVGDEMDPQDIADRDIFFQDLLQAVAQHDVARTLQLCMQSPSCSEFLAAHAAHLLSYTPSARSMLSESCGRMRCTIVESFMLDYINSLLPQPSMWRVAAEYVAWCAVHGASIMQSMLQHIPCCEQRNAVHAALRLCDKHALHSIATNVCSTAGMALWQQGLTGAALRYLMRCGMDVCCSALRDVQRDAEHAVLQPCTQLSLPPALYQLEDALYNLQDDSSIKGGNGSVGDTMAFLWWLLQLGKALDDARSCTGKNTAWRTAVNAARDAVWQLVVLRRAPRRLWPALMLKIVTLLESDTQLFSFDETQRIMLCLRDAAAYHGRTSSRGGQCDDGVLSVVELALARALAHAHVFEAVAQPPSVAV